MLVTVAVYCVLGSSGKKGLVLTVLPLTVIVPGITAPPTVSTNVKVAALNVEVAIASEKVAETEELVAMPVAAFAGEVAETVGGVESADAPVVKLQTKSDVSALPDESFAAVLTVAEYCVFGTRLEEGANIATLPLTATTPAIGGPPAVGAPRRGRPRGPRCAARSTGAGQRRRSARGRPRSRWCSRRGTSA